MARRVEDYGQWMRLLNGHYLMNRLRHDESDDEWDEGNWDPIPQAWFNEYFLKGTDLRSMEWNRNWTLAQNDQGVMTFHLKYMGGGLVIGLSHLNNDFFGYWIVIDDDQHQSYIMRRTGVGANTPMEPLQVQPPLRRLPGCSSTDFQFDGGAEYDMWISYDFGHIQVGLGNYPMVGPVILECKDPHSAPGIQQVGFGKVGFRAVSQVLLTKVQSYRKRRHRAALAPYGRTPNAPHYQQCWREHHYPR